MNSLAVGQLIFLRAVLSVYHIWYEENKLQDILREKGNTSIKRLVHEALELSVDIEIYASSIYKK